MAHLLSTILLPAALLLSLGFGLIPRLRSASARVLTTPLWLSLAGITLLVYALAVAAVASYPVTVDAVEATVASTAYLVLHGTPLYTGLADPARYSLLYGPMCTLPLAAALALFGGTLAALKTALVIFNLALLTTLWLTFRRVLPASPALVATAGTAAALMMKNMAVFLIRGDAPLALTVALALLATSFRRRPAAVAVFALAAAWAIDIKFTAVFYLLLPAYFLLKRQGRLAALATALLTGALALLPFALPQVSLRNYLLWLHEASHHPLGLRLFAMNVIEDLILLTPIALLLLASLRTQPEQVRQLLRRHWLPAALLLVGLAGTTLVGSKIGAGRSHLNPDALLAFYTAAVFWRRLGRQAVTSSLLPAFAVYALFLIVPAVSQLAELWPICIRRHALAVSVNQDITALLAASAGRTLQMAYDFSGGPNPVDDFTLFKTRLVFAGQPLTVDPGGLFDMGLSGLPIPPATIQAIHACQTQTWLVPRNTVPFSLYNTYFYDVPKRFPDPLLFSPAFRQAFFATYQRTGTTRYYDLWTCTQPLNERSQSIVMP